MSQSKRLGALNKYKSKTRTILIATDVASRGLDIPHVDIVINFDIPTHSKDYIHRVGRTARAGKSGRSITFVTQYDVELYQRIEHLIGKKLPLHPMVEEEVSSRVVIFFGACPGGGEIFKEKEEENQSFPINMIPYNMVFWGDKLFTEAIFLDPRGEGPMNSGLLVSSFVS